MERDRVRDEYLREQRIRTLRFWNFQLRENLDGVLKRIRRELDEAPHPNPLPVGEGKERGPLPEGEEEATE
jgi:very-short-patch-repair endonuclease